MELLTKKRNRYLARLVSADTVGIRLLTATEAKYLKTKKLE